MVKLADDRYIVISSDGHAGAQMHEYREYLEAKYLDEFDEWAKSYVNPFTDLRGETAYRNWDSKRASAGARGRRRRRRGALPEHRSRRSSRRATSSRARPTNDEYELRWAGLKAHNRWMADFCADTPGRRAGMAQIFLNDVDDAVAEIQWAREHDLFGGILLPGVPPDSGLPPLFAPDYEPIWAGVRRPRHAGQQPQRRSRPRRRGATWRRWRSSWSSSAGSRTACSGTWCSAACSRATRASSSCSPSSRRGGCPRCSTCSTTSTAASATRAPPSRTSAASCVKRSRSRRATTGNTTASRARASSARAGCRCATRSASTASCGARTTRTARARTRTPREALRNTFAGVPTDEVAPMVGVTAVDVYGFDLDVLAPVAERVGPTVERGCSRSTQIPADSLSMAFAGEDLKPW